MFSQTKRPGAQDSSFSGYLVAYQTPYKAKADPERKLAAEVIVIDVIADVDDLTLPQTTPASLPAELTAFPYEFMDLLNVVSV